MNKQITADQLHEWVTQHKKHYDIVELNLKDTHREFKHADQERRREMLLGSYKFAAISVQTPVAIHERAWTALMGGTDYAEALKEVNYWRNKAKWMRETESRFEHIDNVLKRLDQGNVKEAQQLIVNHFKGVGLKKSAFTLAMLGYTDMFCIDTNVRQAAGVTFEYTGKKVDVYHDTVDDIVDTYSIVNRDPFLIQWSLFDAMRGEPYKHNTFFKHI